MRPLPTPAPGRTGPMTLDDQVRQFALNEAVLDSLDTGIVACDADGRLTVFNRVSREFHGQRADGTITQDRLAESFDLFRGDGVTRLPADEIPLLRCLRDGEVHDLEIVIAPRGLPRRLVSCTGRQVMGPQDEVLGAVIAMRDITMQRQSEQLLREAALRDPLTGLPNRTWLFEQLEHGLQRLGTGSGRLALLFVDLDGFRLTNDLHGHAGGDALLEQAADRLRGTVSAGEQVARLGGDEFVVWFLQSPNDERHRAVDLARGTIDALSRPFVVDGQGVRLSASIGIAFADEHDVSAAELVSRADAAMYDAKGAGKGRWATYSSRSVSAAKAASRIEHLVRRSLDGGGFEVHYQPVYALQTQQIVGVEALARVPDGEGGYVPPVDFVPVAERSGLISRVGEAVLGQAARQLVTWKAGLGNREFTVGVNLSVRELGDPRLLERVSGTLSDSGLPPDALALELTESVFSDSDEHSAVLQALRALGPRLFVDDFGTGYSSLSYLRRFAVDGLKIDRSFVADIADPRDRRVTQAIVSMAVDLGVPVIAEGIETDRQLSALIEMGCTLGQGFLLARPQPADRITALLAH